jgi:hypothetical protein
MRSAIPSLLGAVALMAATSAGAAPADQSNCVLDQLNDQQQAIVGEYSIVAVARRGQVAETPAAKQALDAFETAITTCTGQHGWSENEASSALAYSTIQLVAKSSRVAIVEMGGDADAADLFYAQNKYKILEESAADRNSEEWATTRLIEMGFAKKDSPAFNALWVYLQALFQSESELEAFVTGKQPEWTN